MVFSSPIFLFLFLPLVLACSFFSSLRLRNIWLLFFSVLFYAWGEPVFVLLMLASVSMNHWLGWWLDGESRESRRRWIVFLAVAWNVGLLACFKYANFAADSLNTLITLCGMPPVKMDPVRLPIGISFFTFHGISHVIDIYRRKWPASKNPANTALYMFFFPQLIAGPILRWSAIAPQVAQRLVTRAGFAEGVRRFVFGLAKKVIIANPIGQAADQIFLLSASELLTAPLAWLGAACYALQIYFDFSGYSDMAIGLGKMFGFEFMENFNYPYVSQSVRDFWRRWHISLSTWFRDYLYIPLGGNRCSTKRNYLNLLIVFYLCGLWHGASWTFVIWGLYHGAFLVVERTKAGIWMERMWRPLRHVYALLVILCGWVLFRAESLSQAGEILGSMVGVHSGAITKEPLTLYLTNQVMLAMGAGVLLAAGVWPQIMRLGERAANQVSPSLRFKAASAGWLAEVILIGVLLIVSSAWLAGGTYNPFIYFRF